MKSKMMVMDGCIHFYSLLFPSLSLDVYFILLLFAGKMYWQFSFTASFQIRFYAYKKILGRNNKIQFFMEFVCFSIRFFCTFYVGYFKYVIYYDSSGKWVWVYVCVCCVCLCLCIWSDTLLHKIRNEWKEKKEEKKKKKK